MTKIPEKKAKWLIPKDWPDKLISNAEITHYGTEKSKRDIDIPFIQIRADDGLFVARISLWSMSYGELTSAWGDESSNWLGKIVTLKSNGMEWTAYPNKVAEHWIADSTTTS